MSPLKRCVAKSAAQISTKLTGTQLSRDLSGVLAIRHKLYLNPLTPTVAIAITAIKHPVRDRVMPPIVIFDIWAL